MGSVDCILVTFFIVNYRFNTLMVNAIALPTL